MERKRTKLSTGNKSILELGYGPLSNVWEEKNPKGLTKKVREGEVVEYYLGDGIGSHYEKTDKATKNELAEKERDRLAQWKQGYEGVAGQVKSATQKPAPKVAPRKNVSKVEKKTEDEEDNDFKEFLEGLKQIIKKKK